MATLSINIRSKNGNLPVGSTSESNSNVGDIKNGNSSVDRITTEEDSVVPEVRFINLSMI